MSRLIQDGTFIILLYLLAVSPATVLILIILAVSILTVSILATVILIHIILICIILICIILICIILISVVLILISARADIVYILRETDYGIEYVR